MKIGLAQLDYTIGDLEHNVRKITFAVHDAYRRGAELVVFSELAVMGYPPKDLLEKPSFVREALEVTRQLIAGFEHPTVIFGSIAENPAPTGKRLFNTAYLCSRRHVLSAHHKNLLPTYDVFDESRYFEPGHDNEAVTWQLARLGISVCEDIWNEPEYWSRQLYQVNPIEVLVEQGAQTLINIAASPFTMGKPRFREELLSTVARKHQRPLVFVNQVGGNDSLVFDGHSAVFDAQGRVIARARGFAEEVLVCDLEQGGPLWPQQTDLEQVLEALTAGLRDYVHKCGFKRVVLGLSGGIDSALTAAIAVRALGAEQVVGVAMPSPFTSQASNDDAAELARNLGIEFRSIPIAEVFAAYKHTLAPEFAGRREDVTEENLQARIRANLMMALSNKFGWLLLTTGNKSELAVGYCTLYGDMCGGLAVISDVPKIMVYQLAHIINKRNELIPYNCFTKPPSAELRPDQKDTDSLPPYEVLDPILGYYIEDSLGAEEIAAQGFDPAVVRRVIGMVDRNEYKRQQAAPGLKVTGKAFGFGRRMPIAAVFEQEQLRVEAPGVPK